MEDRHTEERANKFFFFGLLFLFPVPSLKSPVQAIYQKAPVFKFAKTNTYGLANHDKFKRKALHWIIAF